MLEIKQNIEAIRKEKGINQDVLAQKLGVTQSTYSGYFTKTEGLSCKKLWEIADNLGVPVIDIITYPKKYVPEEDRCSVCKEKDKTIENLNSLIELLNGKIKKLKT